MKGIVLLGFIFLVLILFPEDVAAASQIDTSNIYIMAYYKINELPEVDLSRAIQEFDYVGESTGQYVEGKLVIWHNYPNGRDTGASDDFEVRDGVVTDIRFSTIVNVRVKSDGWVVAWLTNEQDLSDIIYWNNIGAYNLYPPDTSLGQSIWRITNRLNADYSKDSVKYYSYKYPEANRLLIGGKNVVHAWNPPKMYYFLIPSTITLYDADILWTSYIKNDLNQGTNYGILKLDNEEIYNKSTDNFSEIGLYEYARYSQNIMTLLKDVRHVIYMDDSGYITSGRAVIGSAVALLYKSG